MHVLTNIEKHAGALLRVCPYHRRYLDLVVVRSRPHDMKPVLAAPPSAFDALPIANFGELDGLLTEIMVIIDTPQARHPILL